MKIGIDFHGVITKNPKLFAKLTETIMMGNPDSEIHLMTGARMSTLHKQWDKKKYDGIYITHWFSISDYIKKNFPDKIDLSDPDHPRVEDVELWDRQKGDYARRNKLDLIIDDTMAYALYSTTPFAHFTGR